METGFDLNKMNLCLLAWMHDDQCADIVDKGWQQVEQFEREHTTPEAEAFYQNAGGADAKLYFTRPVILNLMLDDMYAKVVESLSS